MSLTRRAGWAGALFSGFAALCATWLSGLSFPEQNNIWTIPVVLDFAGSAEGPHDPYHASFARFVSLFWFALRPLVSEATIQPAYVALQLAGNALLAATLYVLVRRSGGSALRGSMVIALLCFAYGLWGATRLGYSELFSTYATHTQYAVILCLAALALVTAERGGAAGLATGLAALTNLFMGVWGALAGGLALILLERRIATPAQWRFAAGFLVLALPLTGWALAGGSGEGPPPVEFFRSIARGHIYALSYPQAAVQAVALGVCAALALSTAHDEGLRRLGLAMTATVTVLVLAIAMPYLAERPMLLLLHPLRFVSVTTLLGAAGAAALLTHALDRDDAETLLPAGLAVAGFLFKLPVVSLFGLALAVPVARPRLRQSAALVALIGILGTALPTPVAEVPVKAVAGYAIMAAALALLIWRQSHVATDIGPLALPTAAGLGAAVVAVPAPASLAALLCATLAATATLAGPRLPARLRQWTAQGMALLAIGLACVASRDEPLRVAVIGGSAVLLGLAPHLPLSRLSLLRQPATRRTASELALAALVAVLLFGGLARGARDRFGPQPDAARRDWSAAQRWTREHVEPDRVILPIGVPDGFALFARRPVWWEDSQKAAGFWAPSFYPVWRCRRDALAAATTIPARIALASAARVDWILIPADAAGSYASGGAAPTYRNGHYALVPVPRPAAAARQPVPCPFGH